jgi:hypothetical protein
MADQPKPFISLSLVRQTLPQDAQLKGLTQFSEERDGIPHEDIAETLRNISRRFDRFPLKSRALDLYSNRRIHLLGNKETVKVPTFLPGWRVAAPRGVTSFVNAVPYIPASGVQNIDPRKLFGLILLGQILVDTIDSWPRISSSAALATAGATVYSRMMFKIADRIAGTGSDRMRSDQVKYLFAKYFLIGMMGAEPGEAVDAAANDVAPGTAVAALEAFEANAAYKSDKDDQKAFYGVGILDFISQMSKADDWLGRLTSRGFIQAFTSLYNTPSLLACEDAAFFFAMLANHQAGSELISSYSFDPIYGNEGPEVLLELARLCG